MRLRVIRSNVYTGPGCQDRSLLIRPQSRDEQRSLGCWLVLKYSGLDSVLDHCCIGSEGNSFNVTNAITGKINEIFFRIFEKTFSKVIHSQSKIVIQNNNTPHHKF